MIVKHVTFIALAAWGIFLSPLESPALSSDEIIFNISFDDTTANADMSKGSPNPKQRQGKLVFAEGIRGMAMLCGKSGGKLFFEIKDNIDFSAPGTVTFWFLPEDSWLSSKERGRCELFGTEGGRTAYIGLQMENYPRNRPLADQCFYISTAYFKSIPNVAFTAPPIGASGLGKWHLVAVAWDNSQLYLSIDGKPFASKKLGGNFTADLFAPPTMLAFGSTTSEAYRLDEFTVYSKRLADSEILSKFKEEYPANQNNGKEVFK